MNNIAELLKLRDIATEAGLLPPAPTVKTVEVEQIQVIPKEVEVETISLQTLSEKLINYLPSASEAALEGFTDPIKLYKQLSSIEDICKLAKEMIFDSVMSEAGKHFAEELRVKYGYEIYCTGDRLDYDKDEEIKNLKKLIKEREKKIKFACKNGAFAEFGTGEIIEPVPVKSHGKLTLKKVKSK